MLEVLVGLVAGLLIVAGIIVMLGPNAKVLVQRLAVLRRRRPSLSAFQAARPREVVTTGLNPKTQRVLVAASRLEPRGPRRTGEAQNPVERAARGGSRPVRAAGAAALPPTVAFRDVRPFHLSASGQSTAHLNVLTGYRHRSHATFPALRSDPFAAPPRDTRVAARALKATGGRTPAADREPSSGAIGSSPAGP